MLTPRIRDTLSDLSVRYPVKDALRAALDRDPVDAWKDAQHVADLLRERLDIILHDVTFWPIVCETAGCANQGGEVNRVTLRPEHVEPFVTAYGHGGEDEADYCPACGQLGILHEPEEVTR